MAWGIEKDLASSPAGAAGLSGAPTQRGPGRKEKCPLSLKSRQPQDGGSTGTTRCGPRVPTARGPLTEPHQPDGAGCFWWGPEASLKSTASHRPRRNAILLPRDNNEYLSPLHQADHMDTAGWVKGVA